MEEVVDMERDLVKPLVLEVDKVVLIQVHQVHLHMNQIVMQLQ